MNHPATLPIERVWSHPLTRRLLSQGYALTEHCVTKSQGSQMIMGLRLLTETSELVYTFSKPDTIRIVLYRRRGQRRGMQNTYRDFIWLLHECAQPESGIIGVTGVVNAVEGVDSDTLSNQRMVKMYEYLTARVVEEDPLNGLIVYGELQNLERIRKKWPRAPKPATEPQCPSL